MALYDIYLKGHIHGHVNLTARDGTPFVHLLIDSEKGKFIFDQLKSQIYSSKVENLTSISSIYKTKSGAPMHVYGVDGYLNEIEKVIAPVEGVVEIP